MSGIPKTLERLASPEIRRRGLEYFAGKTVRLLQAGTRSVSAQVRGTQSYAVELRQRAGAAYYSCTCPYFEREIEVCKHVWAVLETVAARFGLETWPQRIRDWEARPELAAADFEPEEESSLEHGVDDEAAPAAALAEPAGPAGKGWRTACAQVERLARDRRLSAVEVPEAAERELLYVLRAPLGRAGPGLRLSCEVRSPVRGGGWGKRTFLRLERGRIAAFSGVADRKILGLLAGVSAAESFSGSFEFRRREPLPHSFDLEPVQLEALLPMLCGTGRLRAEIVGAGGARELGPPIVWRPEPWRIRLHLDAAADAADPASTREPNYRLVAELWQGERRLEASDRLLWLVPGGTLIATAWASPFDDGETPEWLGLAAPGGAVLVPAAEVDLWLAALHRLPRLPELELPPHLALEEVDVPPRPRLSISAPARVTSWSPRQVVTLALSFTYGEERLDAVDPRSWLLDLGPGRRRRMRRDWTAEAAATGRLQALGARSAPASRAAGSSRLEIGPGAVPELARALLAEGWEVEAESRALRPAGRASFNFSSGVDWFDLAGGIEFGDEVVPLPRLLRALRAGKGMVALGDGSYGLLPEAWLVKNALLEDVGELAGDSVRLTRPQALFVDAWLQEDAAVEVVADAGFAHWRRELAGFAGIAPAAPPKSFRGELRGYQREGLGWLMFLERCGFGGCLADDMGLGKTVQILALLAGRRARLASRSAPASGSPVAPGRRPSLIVVPASLLYNWRQEAARFAPRLSILELRGADRRCDPVTLAQFDLVLITYGTLKRDIERLARIEFDYCILDEAQAIKNAKTAAARAVRRLRAEHRLVATGTPVENHLGELWSLFEFLNPGLLGRSSSFQSLTGAARQVPQETRERLATALRPFLLRRTKRQVAPELPPKTEQTILCEVEGTQRRLYDELREHYRRSLAAKVARQGWAKSKIQVLEALLRLRQAACHPGLLDPARARDESAKFESLLPRLEEILEEGSKALVFSQFTSLLSLLKLRLDAKHWSYEYLDGATTDRQARVERFQNAPDCPLFLVSLKAGGLGLNLTAAEYVFLLDPWWNPAVEAQAIDRAHRIGQRRPVFAYRLIARNTVEERILELQAGKRELADALLGGDPTPLASLTRDDFELLLG